MGRPGASLPRGNRAPGNAGGSSGKTSGLGRRAATWAELGSARTSREGRHGVKHDTDDSGHKSFLSSSCAAHHPLCAPTGRAPRRGRPRAQTGTGDRTSQGYVPVNQSTRRLLLSTLGQRAVDVPEENQVGAEGAGPRASPSTPAGTRGGFERGPGQRAAHLPASSLPIHEARPHADTVCSLFLTDQQHFSRKVEPPEK